MKYYQILLLLTIGFFISSCGGSEEEELVALGGKKYGGEFKFMSSEKITTLFPFSSDDHYSSRIVAQIYEPLLRLEPTTMEPVPGIAEKVTVSDDAKVYTFKIRKGIYFHDDDCFGGTAHELTANDVKFSLSLACSGLKENNVSYQLVNRIVGAQEFFKQSKTSLPKNGVSGIKVINGNTVQISLVKPFAGFEHVLTHPSLGMISQKAFETYGVEMATQPVGTGPFCFESMNDEKIVLKRNPNYWRKDELGNQLPFLSKVIMTYTKDKRSELMAFRNSEIDLVLQIPVEEIEHILGTLTEAQEGKNVKHKIESEQSLSMRYISMAIESKEFSDVRVRKAFNLAIDRNAIIDNWLEGEGWAANGFVPTMKNYPNEEVKGHDFNPTKAKQLMKDAGYPDGKNFPTLDLYINAVEGSHAHKICMAVAKQLKSGINVDLNIKLCDLNERKEAIANGKAKIWSAGWIADYPDPESFLTMFYGGNATNSGMVNVFNFKDAEYDALYEEAISEIDDKKRNLLMVKCDQMIVDKAATIPLITGAHIVMVNARVRSFKANPMESLNLTEIFIKEPKK